MKPLAASEIKGNWAALLLPINEDESIDYGRLAAELDYLAASGVSGIYTNGTAAEFYAQSEDEFDRISQMVAERCEPAGVPFQIGASHMSPQVSLSRIRRAVQLRPGAVQVILSDWFPLSDAEMVACLERFSEAADPIGLVLYNPSHAKRVLRPADFARLVEAVPGLVGAKVRGGDDAWYAAMRPLAGRLSIFVAGHNLATGITRGATGAYSNVACLHPKGAQRWYEQMQTDLDGALDFQARFHRFRDEYLVPLKTEHALSGAAIDKLMAAVGAWADVGTRLRWPYRGAPAGLAGQLRPAACELMPEMFEE
jgi:dihydrodipicolinate synthase/N-acetylneuraminate lyase